MNKLLLLSFIPVVGIIILIIVYIFWEDKDNGEINEYH